jgi:hypothetical protein
MNEVERRLISWSRTPKAEQIGCVKEQIGYVNDDDDFLPLVVCGNKFISWA